MEWTKEQQKVIDFRGGNLLVSAAAGSGKTAVMIERIIRKVLDEKEHTGIDDIVVVTFTKAAAEEINPADLRQIPMELAVYELTGPLFFGAADRINQIEVNEVTRCLILRMRAVPAADSTAMNSMTALCERCKKNGVTLILSHVNEQPMHVMEKAGFVDMIGRDHFCPNIEAALDHADEVLRK